MSRGFPTSHPVCPYWSLQLGSGRSLNHRSMAFIKYVPSIFEIWRSCITWWESVHVHAVSHEGRGGFYTTYQLWTNPRGPLVGAGAKGQDVAAGPLQARPGWLLGPFKTFGGRGSLRGDWNRLFFSFDMMERSEGER